MSDRTFFDNSERLHAIFQKLAWEFDHTQDIGYGTYQVTTELLLIPKASQQILSDQELTEFCHGFNRPIQQRGGTGYFNSP